MRVTELQMLGRVGRICGEWGSSLEAVGAPDDPKQVRAVRRAARLLDRVDDLLSALVPSAAGQACRCPINDGEADDILDVTIRPRDRRSIGRLRWELRLARRAVRAAADATAALRLELAAAMQRRDALLTPARPSLREWLEEIGDCPRDAGEIARAIRREGGEANPTR